MSHSDNAQSIRVVLQWGKSWVLIGTGFLGLVMSGAVAAQNQGGIEEIVVTAQKREQSLQEVPIAVSAFDVGNLDRQQIDRFSDLQFTAPNVSFGRGNFSTNNFQIRGIGSAEIAASGDAGVGFHMNDTYLNAPRIADTEFYDIERIEVLRGPQGTLYGRNSTGGAVNVVTARPDLNHFGAYGNVQYGNYDHVRVKGMVNVPVSEQLGIRLAGIYLNRDGYTDNVNPNVNFSDIDDRDQWSGRVSIRFEPGAGTNVDVLYQHFEEDDSRSRSNKSLCNFDPSAILGCTPLDLANETTNFDSTLGRVFTSDLVLPPGFFLTPFGTASSGINPADPREVYVDTKPQYNAKEDLFSFSVNHELNDALTFTGLANYHRTSHSSQQGFTNAVGTSITVPAGLQAALPTTYATYYADGCFPISARDPNGTGIVGGFVRDCLDVIQHLDESGQENEQYGFEARITSDFDGRFNFLLAMNYLNFERQEDYYVFNNTVDYFMMVAAGPLGFGVPPNPALDTVALLTPYFRIQTDEYRLKTWATFGEGYFDVTDKMKLTVGLRYTNDDKKVRDRQYPLATGGAVSFVGFDSSTAEDAWLAAGFDANPAAAGQQLFRETSASDDAVTGRVVVDYRPEVPFTDDTLVYASYSRGYRGGGFNPAFDPAEFPGTPSTYDPEYIDAFEVGAKNTLFGRKVTLNLSGFYYDYEGYQIVKTVNRALINENIDASMRGLEAELTLSPSNNWLFNLNLATLDTRIGSGASTDPLDPTNGQINSTLIKSVANTENCVINWNGGNGDPMVAPPAFLIPSPGGATPGIASGSAAFSAVGCGDALQGALDATYGAGAYTTQGGNEANLKGNELPSAPDMSVSVGGQYSMDLTHNLSLQIRMDYYYQSSMWARIFNRNATDRIGAWDTLNAQATLYGRDDRWFVRAFVKNMLDDDNVTGHYLNAPSSGLFTNVFLLEPRQFGLEVGIRY